MAPEPNPAQFEVLLCLPTAPALPAEGSGDFGTSPLYGQLSDKPLLVLVLNGVRAVKHNSGSRSQALSTLLPTGIRPSAIAVMASTSIAASSFRRNACILSFIQRQPQASDGLFGTFFAFALVMLNPESVAIIASNTRNQPQTIRTTAHAVEILLARRYQFGESGNVPVLGERYLTQRIEGHAAVRGEKLPALPMLHIADVRKSSFSQFFR